MKRPGDLTVAVGMSGGVDSSVSALLLKEQGYNVVGLFMKNWDESDCPAKEDFEDVARVCDHLEIPYYSFDFSKDYWDEVFAHFLKEIELGYTPNPDILCNREIKFKVFLEKALSLGADYLATGHYAQVSEAGALLRGKDANKDQSYFLYTLKEEQLKKVLFPIGHLPKPEVRAIADQAGLHIAEKKDSTGICFIGKRKFKDFLKNYIPEKEGRFITLEGEVVGTHPGAVYYTIGQRKGLGIGGPGEAYFVIDKDIESNTVVVAQGQNHPSLFSDSLEATEISWVKGDLPETPFRCTAKIRYRQNDSLCTVEKQKGDRLFVRFDEPQRAVTPRQSVVFYQGDQCLGGAMIA